MEGQQIWNRFRKYFCFSCWIKWNTNRNTRRDQRYELREAYSCFIELNETKNKAFSWPSKVYTPHVEVITFSFTAKDTRRQRQRHLSSGMYELFRCSQSALFLCLSCLCFSVVKTCWQYLSGYMLHQMWKTSFFWHIWAIHSPLFFYYLYVYVKNNDPFVM